MRVGIIVRVGSRVRVDVGDTVGEGVSVGKAVDVWVLVGNSVAVAAVVAVAVAVGSLPLLPGPKVAIGTGAANTAVTFASRSSMSAGLGHRSMITSRMMFRLIAGTGLPLDSKPYSASSAECRETGKMISCCESPTRMGAKKAHRLTRQRISKISHIIFLRLSFFTGSRTVNSTISTLNDYACFLSSSALEICSKKTFTTCGSNWIPLWDFISAIASASLMGFL